MRFSSEMGSLTLKRSYKQWPNEDDSPAYSWTILRPGMSRKWRRLTVKTGKPSSSAVAPTSRSPKGMVTPWACCSPSIFPGQQGRCLCVRIDRQIAQQFIDEGLAEKPHCLGLRTIYSVDEFRQPNRRERGILIACHGDDLLDQFLDCIPSALDGDDDAGVEDQAHGFSSGSGWLLMTPSRS